jgi:hypothetical protein
MFMRFVVCFQGERSMSVSQFRIRLTGVFVVLAAVLGLGVVGEIGASPVLSPAMQSVTGKVGTAITPTAPLSSPIFGHSPTFVITPALPTGLVLNVSTGVVSGTSVAEFPRTMFTVTGSDGSKQASATVLLSVTVTGLPPSVVLNSSRPGCKPVTFAANVRTTLQAVDTELPNLDFACSVHIGIKNAGFAFAISVQGSRVNAKVSRYLVNTTRVGGTSTTKYVSVRPPAQVIRRQFRPLSPGTWVVAVTALAPNGTSMGTWTSDTFVIG